MELFTVLPFTTDDASADHQRIHETARLKRVVQSFRNAYPSLTSRKLRISVAPGRVNLIGEHVDYEGYSVLPMAIAHNVAIACTSSPSDALRIHVVNANPSYAPLSIVLTRIQLLEHLEDTSIVDGARLYRSLTGLTTPATTWIRYVMCGLMAVIEWEPALLKELREIHLIVDGAVPPACGLSSSSALVVASALAFASGYDTATNQLSITRMELAERCRYAEQYVGTVGGGMDQAVSCLARRDTALHVSFSPRFTVEAVEFSAEFQRKEAMFLVVNSGVEAHKAVDATAFFNKRVIECALAAKMLGKTMGLAQWQQVTRLHEIQANLSTLTLSELLDHADSVLEEEVYTQEQLEGLLGASGGLVSLFTGSRLEKAAERVLATEATFKLRQRVRHVWSEADRVLQFRSVLESSDNASTNRLQELGRLMLESHASCRDLYECSCRELDQIVTTAVAAGAYGARLTGAGWGGCAVVLVAADQAAVVRERLQRECFQSSASSSIFESTACDGAQLFALD